MATDYSAVCLAIALKFDLVHPGTGSTALLANHIPGFGSEREILEVKARLQEPERPTAWRWGLGGAISRASNWANQQRISAQQLSIYPFSEPFADDSGDLRAIWAIQPISAPTR